LLALVATAQAEDYSLTYNASTSDGTTATGQLDIVGGQALSGTLDVTAGPDAGNYILVAPGSGADGSFSYDNLVDPSNPAFLDSVAGLVWTVSGAQDGSAEMNMWYNAADISYYGSAIQPGGSFSLWGAPPNWNVESYGTATLTANSDPVPDGGLTVALLSGALVGLQVLRRKLLC